MRKRSRGGTGWYRYHPIARSTWLPWASFNRLRVQLDGTGTTLYRAARPAWRPSRLHSLLGDRRQPRLADRGNPASECSQATRMLAAREAGPCLKPHESQVTSRPRPPEMPFPALRIASDAAIFTKGTVAHRRAIDPENQFASRERSAAG
jgi:hypothetical protein